MVNGLDIYLTGLLPYGGDRLTMCIGCFEKCQTINQQYLVCISIFHTMILFDVLSLYYTVYEVGGIIIPILPLGTKKLSNLSKARQLIKGRVRNQ